MVARQKVLVVGIDPGKTTGLAAVGYDPSQGYLPVHFAELGPSNNWGIIKALVEVFTPTVVAAEQFVVGKRAGRSASSSSGELARTLLGQLQTLDYKLELRNAATVKAWATNERLKSAGLLAPTVGQGHARDAARHALYAIAIHGWGPDPFSHEYTALVDSDREG